MFFILLSSIIITTFISSFFLNKTPKIFIILPSILLCYYISTKDKDVMKWLSLALTFFSIITIIFKLLALMPHMEIKNILPLFTFYVKYLYLDWKYSRIYNIIEGNFVEQIQKG